MLAENDPAPKLGRCRVVGFNGRSTDAPGGIWGSIAEQLHKGDRVICRRSEQTVQLIRASGVGFFDVLREKLQWGG